MPASAVPAFAQEYLLSRSSRPIPIRSGEKRVVFMNPRLTFRSLLTICILSVSFSGSLSAQARVPERIGRNIEKSSSVPVRGNVHPFATAQHDRGRVSDSFRMQHVTMIFRPTDAQQQALDKLLEEQQDIASPNYHRWLSPDEFADHFGLNANDVNKIVIWLRDKGSQSIL